MDETLQELGAYLEVALGDAIEAWQVRYGELTVSVARTEIVSVARFLRDDARCQFINITDICGVDYPEREKRFDVVYHLLSPKQNLRIRLKVATDDRTPVPSLTGVFPGADWFEREAYDMYGMLFFGPSRPAPVVDRLWLRWPSAAQGLPAHRLCGSSL